MNSPAKTIPVKLVQPPPTPREMLRIALGLTVVCLIAGIILAFFYALTQPAKERNLKAREVEMIRQLLGLPVGARVDEVRRYLHWRGNEPDVIYLLPKRLLTLSAEGVERGTLDVPGEIGQSQSSEARDTWVRQALQADEGSFKFGGRFFVGRNAGALAGYVVEGVTPGYKTWIRFFLALDADFRLRGLEIVQHEEDPGLGAEITQRYFKNQFAGRSFDEVAALEVTKDPLPQAWRKAVDELGGISFPEWFSHYAPELQRHPNIHAITGSTISSQAVTDGVKRSLGNFRKRMQYVGNQL